MSFTKTIIVPLTILVLSGCASQETYHAVLDSWIGSNKSELIRSWGKPSKSYSQGNSTYLVYDKNGPGSDDMDYKKAVVTIGGCTTTFEIVDDTIISSSYKGEDCRARTEQVPSMFSQ